MPLQSYSLIRHFLACLRARACVCVCEHGGICVLNSSNTGTRYTFSPSLLTCRLYIATFESVISLEWLLSAAERWFVINHCAHAMSGAEGVQLSRAAN